MLHGRSNLTDVEAVYTHSVRANRIKFVALTVLQLFAVPCYLYIFRRVYTRRQFHRSRQHHQHVMLLLLIVSFLFVTVCLPFTQVYMYTSRVYPASETFCSFWNWFHYSLNITNLFLMAFASLERNWLIFHPWLVRTRCGQFFLHYCPLLFCLLYPPLFYFGAIFMHKCESYYDFSQLLCKWPCYFHERTWANIDTFVNNQAVLYSIPVFCLIIYVRVCLQKRALQLKPFKWRRDRKMIIQLSAISTFYLLLWLPLQLPALINLCWNKDFLLQAQIDYMYLFPYLIHLIYPYIVLLTFHPHVRRVTRVKGHSPPAL